MNRTAQDFYRRENQRSARNAILRLLLVLVMACAFFVLPFIPWGAP